MDVEVTRDVITAMLAQAQRTPGQECCGLLLGSRAGEPSPAGAAKPECITQALPAANVHPKPARRFEIDPAALIAAYRAQRQGGPALIGFYHSHPGGHPRPSATDCEHAGGDGRVWAIIAGGNVQFWRDVKQGFMPLRVATTG